MHCVSALCVVVINTLAQNQSSNCCGCVRVGLVLFVRYSLEADRCWYPGQRKNVFVTKKKRRTAATTATIATAQNSLLCATLLRMHKTQLTTNANANVRSAERVNDGCFGGWWARSSATRPDQVHTDVKVSASQRHYCHHRHCHRDCQTP